MGCRLTEKKKSENRKKVRRKNFPFKLLKMEVFKSSLDVSTMIRAYNCKGYSSIDTQEETLHAHL